MKAITQSKAANNSESIVPADATQELIKRYLDSLDVKPRSKETYRKALKHFTDWLSSKGTPSVVRETILQYKNELSGRYTACTVSGYMTAVRCFYTYLEAEKITPNVAAGVKGAKSRQGFRKGSLTAEQAMKVLREIDTTHLEGKRDFALINLLTRTGLRTVEAERANIEDIRNEAGETLLYVQGKGRDEKDAFVLLTEDTLNPIRDYLKARGRAQESEPLFISFSDRNRGERLTTRSISRIAKEALIRAGYDDSKLTAHSFRHTAITLSLQGGATIQEAQALARHSSINTTMIYSHNLNRIGRAPERKIDAMLTIVQEGGGLNDNKF